MASRKPNGGRKHKNHSATLRKKPRTTRRRTVASHSGDGKPTQHNPVSRSPKNRKRRNRKNTGKAVPIAVKSVKGDKKRSKPAVVRRKEKRAKAAKKGWATRRKKEREAFEAAIKRRDDLIARQRRTGAQVKKDSAKELAFLRKQGEREYEEFKEEHDHIMERLAIQEEDVMKRKEKAIKDSRDAIEETIILRITKQVMERMFAAEQEGHLDDMSYELADEFGYDRSEIYSMYHGYTPNYLPTTIPF